MPFPDEKNGSTERLTTMLAVTARSRSEHSNVWSAEEPCSQPRGLTRGSDSVRLSSSTCQAPTPASDPHPGFPGPPLKLHNPFPPQQAEGAGILSPSLQRKTLELNKMK